MLCWKIKNYKFNILSWILVSSLLQTNNLSLLLAAGNFFYKVSLPKYNKTCYSSQCVNGKWNILGIFSIKVLICPFWLSYQKGEPPDLRECTLRILVRAVGYTIHGLIPASCVFADRYNREEVCQFPKNILASSFGFLWKEGVAKN